MTDLPARIRRAYDAAKPVELSELHRLRRDRKRRRILSASTAAVVVAVGASVTGLSLAGGGRSEVRVSGAGPTTPPGPGQPSGPSGPGATAEPEASMAVRGGITVRFVLDTPTIPVGGTLRAQLTVTAGKAIHGCPTRFFPLSVTSPDTGRQAPVPAAAACADTSTAIPAGTSSYPIKQAATYQTCTPFPSDATKETPYCPQSASGPPNLPNLPAGRYRVQPDLSAGFMPELPTPPAVNLTIVTGRDPVGTASTAALSRRSGGYRASSMPSSH